MYTFTQQEQTVAANCHYTIRAHNDGSITMTEDPDAKCSSTDYCYIAYFDQTCSSEIKRGNVGAAETEDVWGICLSTTTYSKNCPIPTDSIGGILTKDQGCPAGQYCFLNWIGNNCSNSITNGGITGQMFGMCLDMNDYHVECPIN